LSKDESKETALHKAAGRGEVEILEKLWDWAKNCSKTRGVKKLTVVVKRRV